MFTLFSDDKITLEKIFSYCNQQKLNCNISIEKAVNSLIFNYSDLTDLSLFLTDLIIDIFERPLIFKIIKKNYFYLENDDKNEISNISNSIIEDNSKSKKDLVYLAIYDYLKKNTEMNIDGFITFRLRDYIEVLEYLVDLSANNLIINREYNRFIDLLIEYVNSEKSKIDLIHLVYLNQESILLDKDKNLIPINNNILDAKYLSDISFSSNDYALNTILNLLPNKIYVHILDKEDDFIKTLKKIFDKRINICCDCEICNFYRLTVLK